MEVSVEWKFHREGAGGTTWLGMGVGHDLAFAEHLTQS